MTTKTKLLLTAQDKTKAAFKSVTRSVSGLERTVSKATAAFGIFIGAGAIGGLVKSVASAGLAMDRFNRTFRVVTGSAQGAAREIEFITNLSKRLGLDLETAADAFAKLSAASRGTALAGAETRKIFTALSEATIVLGLSSQDSFQILTAVEQMISKGKVSAEELRRQMQKLPGAFQAAANAMEITTQELDKQLKSGKLMADDLLPKLADELHKTYGPSLPEAVNSAQAAIARFNTAIFQLKVAIAESGVLDALAAMAQGIANIISPGLGLEIQDAQDKIDELKSSIENLRQATSGPAFEGRIRFEESQLSRAELILDELIEKQGRLLNPGFEVPDIGGVSVGGDVAGLDSFIKKYETAAQKITRLTTELKKFKGELDPAEYARIQAKINKIWSDGLEEITVTSNRKILEIKKVHDEMSEFAKQAARNMQTAFADFLFDPFDKGLKGMLKSFIDTIRRMMAEAAAAKFFDSINSSGGGVSGFFASLFGGGKALGGPVDGGTSYLVGERGPELFTPGSSGNITPNNKLSGSIVIHQNYSIAAGADWETLQKVLPPLFEQNRQATIGEIKQLQLEGAF